MITTEYCRLEPKWLEFLSLELAISGNAWVSNEASSIRQHMELLHLLHGKHPSKGKLLLKRMFTSDRAISVRIQVQWRSKKASSSRLGGAAHASSVWHKHARTFSLTCIIWTYAIYSSRLSFICLQQNLTLIQISDESNVTSTSEVFTCNPMRLLSLELQPLLPNLSQ